MVYKTLFFMISLPISASYSMNPENCFSDSDDFFGTSTKSSKEVREERYGKEVIVIQDGTSLEARGQSFLLFWDESIRRTRFMTNKTVITPVHGIVGYQNNKHFYFSSGTGQYNMSFVGDEIKISPCEKNKEKSREMYELSLSEQIQKLDGWKKLDVKEDSNTEMYRFDSEGYMYFAIIADNQIGFFNHGPEREEFGHLYGKFSFTQYNVELSRWYFHTEKNYEIKIESNLHDKKIYVVTNHGCEIK